MSEKIIGYILIITGILVIFLSSLNVYDVFTGKKQAISPFKLNGIGFDVGSLLTPQNQALESSKDQTEIVSDELINDPLNLFAHLFLMGFFVTAGAKISDIGTKLVRPINVSLKGAKPTN